MGSYYTPEEVREICVEKLAEKYHGKITLYFDGSVGMPIIEYSGKYKKAEGNNSRLGSSDALDKR